MATFLFNDIIFGPVKSRRLGSSLGINLLPANRKICSFNCIYCECGWTGISDTSSLPDIISNLKAFKGKLIIQTMFVRGVYKGKQVNNSSQEELEQLFRLYQEIQPEAIMLYTYERDTAASGLEKLPLEEMKKIADDIEKPCIKTLVSF